MNTPTAYAGFWNRFAAVFIDVLILLIPQALFGYLVGTAFLNRMASPDPVQNYLGFEIWSRGIGLGIAWLYFALLESSKYQATIGKMALGLVVTDLAGNPISFGRASGRFFGKLLSSVIFGFGYLMVGFTARKQALHDIMAKCLILKKARHTSAGAFTTPEQIQVDDEHLYLTAQKELDSNSMREGLWAKAFEQHPSDENMRRATYLRFRVAQLRVEVTDSRPPPIPMISRIRNSRPVALIRQYIVLVVIGVLITIGVIVGNWSDISQWGHNKYYDVFWKSMTRDGGYGSKVHAEYTLNGQRWTLRNCDKVAYRGSTIMAFNSKYSSWNEWDGPSRVIEGATDINVYKGSYISDQQY